MPVLILPDGFALIESGVICDYLDGLGSARLIPKNGRARWSALRLQALAQGLCDAHSWAFEKQSMEIKGRSGGDDR